MRQVALMVDNCRHYVIAATGAQGCRALIKVKQTMPGRSLDVSGRTFRVGAGAGLARCPSKPPSRTSRSAPRGGAT